MKQLFCFLLLSLFLALSGQAQKMPLRDQQMGEPRPSWWIDCWADHIVVIKGILRFELHDPPDVEVKISPNALSTYYSNEKDRSLVLATSNYCVATMIVDELLFASPGIDYVDTRIAALREGKVGKIKALVMAIGHPGDEQFFLNVRPGVENKGVFIFRYGSMVSSLPLIFADLIPEDGLADAQTVFEYRERYDYHTRPAGHQPFTPGNEEGFVGLYFSTDFPKIEHVIEDSPAAKAGIRDGDSVVAIGQLKTEGMNPTDFGRLCVGPPGSEVELTIRRADTGKNETFRLERFPAF